MPLSKEQLLDAANIRAAELGVQPVSESVLETWIHKGLLDGARAQGHQRGINPSWDYPDEARDKVALIVELQANGAKRHTQKLICLWVLGGDFEFDEIISALTTEFDRIAKRMLRGPHWWQHHFEDTKKLSDAERNKRIGQLPELDLDLAATGLALSPEAFFEIGLRCHWGKSDASRIPSIIAKELAQKFGMPELLSEKLFLLFDINGALGPHDESAHGGSKILNRISPDDLEFGKAMFRLCVLGLFAIYVISKVFGSFAENNQATVWEKALNSIVMPEWITATVALLAISSFHSRASGNAQNKR